MTVRDPVADMLRYAEMNGARLALAQRRAPSRLRWFLLGVIAGVTATILWAAPSAAQVPLAAEQHRRDVMRAGQSVFGLDAPIASLGAQLMQESAFRADAVSWAGARGLAQFMPATAAALGRQYPELHPVNEFDPRWATRAQAVLMRDLVAQFGPIAANECEAWCYGATAYNGGPRWVQRRIAASPNPARCFAVTSRINPGIRPSAQTENQEYPVRIYLRHEPRFVAAMWGRGVCESYALGG